MEKQATIREATFEDLSFLSEFQISMAKETENLDLTSSIINEAIDYLLHHSEMGLILLATIDNTPVASILGTIESPDRAWIQSVFVHQQHRRKGIFRKMFLEMCQCQRARGFKSIFLYAEKENERALAAYFKLGMSLAEGLRMYGFDFVYSGDQLPTVQKKYQIVPAEETPAQKIDSFRDLLGGERLGNSGLEIHEGEELVGYAEYFQQFSDWRFGRIMYVSKLLIKEASKDVLHSLLRHLEEMEGLKVKAIRFLAQEGSLLTSVIEVPQLHYYVLQMTL